MPRSPDGAPLCGLPRPPGGGRAEDNNTHTPTSLMPSSVYGCHGGCVWGTRVWLSGGSVPNVAKSQPWVCDVSLVDGVGCLMLLFDHIRSNNATNIQNLGVWIFCQMVIIRPDMFDCV